MIKFISTIRRPIKIIFILVLLLVIFAFFLFQKNPPRNFQTYFYDWQPKVEINPSDKAFLVQVMSDTVFLKIGSFDETRGQLTFQRETNWKTLHSYDGMKINACYRLEYHLAQALGKLDANQLSGFIRSKIEEDQRDLQAAGVTVAGIHLDLDCPTSDLPKYAEVLKGLREYLKGQSPQSLSITVLPSWLLSPFRFHSVLKQVDFYVPLFFGYGINRTFEELGPIGGSYPMGWYLFLTRFYGKPYFVGLPNYSLAMVYDPNGSLLSLESDLPISDLIDNPNLRQIDGGMDSPLGGTRMQFTVLQSGLVDGRELEKGWNIVTQEVDGQLIRKSTGEVRDRAPSACKGFLFFRMDKSDSFLGLPLSAVLNASGTKAMDPNIGTAIVGLKEKKDTVRFQVALWNDSDFPSRPMKLPAFTQLRVMDGELLDASQGEFSSYYWSHGFEKKVVPSSLSRANSIRFMTRRLMPHERITSGVIQVRKISPDFSLYLYADVPCSTGSFREILHDYEVYPQFVAPAIEAEEYKP